MAQKKPQPTRQQRANARAKKWGFGSDYQYRKFKRKNGLIGLPRTKSDSAILDAIDSPVHLRRLRTTGKLAEILAGQGWTYYDPKTKTRKPMDKQRLDRHIKSLQGRNAERVHHWKLPAKLTRKADYDQMIMLGAADFKPNESKGRLDALFYLMVLRNGLTPSQFYNQYRDVVIESNVDYDEYVEGMIARVYQHYDPDGYADDEN